MRKRYIILAFLFIHLQFLAQDNIWTYLEQNCPDSIPEVFAPGIVSGIYHEHSSPIFDSNGNMVTWKTVRNSSEGHVKMKTVYSNNSFSEPILVPSNVDPAFRLHFRFNYNGKDSKIVFCTKNALPEAELKNIPIKDIVTERFNKKLLSNLSGPVLYDTLKTGYRISLTTANTLFLDKRKIYYSNFTNGEFQEPKQLCNDLNQKTHDWMPFIAADESYIIFVSDREGGYGSYDLYVTFSKDEGWTTPINMGNRINTEKQERCPGVTPDGKYLFFTRPNPPNKDDIWWINASIIEELKNELNNK